MSKDTGPKTGWVDQMMEAYNEGASDEEVIKTLGITRTQFDNYCHDVPAFAELVERGRDYAKAWWMEQGRKAIKEKNDAFPQSLYAYSMANKYGWSSKSDRTNTTVDLVSYDKAREELARILPQISSMLNIKDVLDKSGSSMDHVFKCTVFMADMKEWDAMNEVYVTFFPNHKPARSALGANGLALNAKVEIECLAKAR